MIIISFLGLDPFISEHISKKIDQQMAKLFDCSLDDIIVYAPESYLYHHGVDQTSWQTIVQIHAPEATKNNKDKIAQHLHKILKEHLVHLSVQFSFYHPGNQYEFIDPDHPKFVTSANEVIIKTSQEQEIYQGDVFGPLNNNDDE